MVTIKYQDREDLIGQIMSFEDNDMLDPQYLHIDLMGGFVTSINFLYAQLVLGTNIHMDCGCCSYIDYESIELEELDETDLIELLIGLKEEVELNIHHLNQNQ